MNATAALPVVGVDLAKSVFQLAIADHVWRIVEQHRLTRTQFERFFANRAVGLVIMEACGSALLEAARCAEIVPVRVKSIEQQALQGLHRTRSL